MEQRVCRDGLELSERKDGRGRLEALEVPAGQVRISLVDVIVLTTLIIRVNIDSGSSIN